MWENRKVISRIEEMLAEAMDGRFQESRYDESELSRLESRFCQYLGMRETTMERAEKERAAIKGLVTDISHQTKTPLANILLYTELLEEQQNMEDAAVYVRQIRRQAEKLDFLIQALVKISRLESGMIEVKAQAGAVLPLIEKTVKLASGWAQKKGISIKCKPVPENAAAVYDEGWTQEALGNLLDNAIKYSPKESTVTVSVRVGEMFVCICVEDEGPGIPEAESAQIFERFYRGENALQKEGTGVGLYLTRMILQKESGYVRVSAREGGGSRFQMYLKRSV